MFWGIMSVIFGAAGATLLFTGADLWGRDEFLLLAIEFIVCLLYTSPRQRDVEEARIQSSA